MTEEIIIDGVNVVGCEYYFEDNGVIAPDGTPERANLCTSPERSCENSDSCYCNKECYYKQLKRLEQENKELRQQYNCYACDTCNGKEDYRNMKRHCENAIKTVHKYRSALEKIQKAIKSYDLAVDNGVSVDTLYTIGKIINEVLQCE